MQFTQEQAKKVLKEVTFRRGMVTAVSIDHKTKDVLMVANQNRQAVLKSLTEGTMWYWSRSRKKLWQKGERSGHTQSLRGLRLDCDGDAILYFVEQMGGACHEGYRSCFHLEVKEDGKVVEGAPKIFDPYAVYQE